jgi:hypothetical protein
MATILNNWFVALTDGECNRETTFEKAVVKKLQILHPLR